MRTLFRNGRVHSPTDPRAGALLVEDGVVLWVGSDDAAPDAADTVDLAGAWVAPAFVDAHVHATATGLALTGLDLGAAASLAEALALVERHARGRRGGTVLGTGWDETRWPERRAPTTAELDRATYGGVAYLARADVHSAAVSSALLAAVPEARSAAGWDPAGHVRLDAHHLLRQAAYSSVSRGQRRDAQRAMLSQAAAMGIGCVHEMAGPEVSGLADLTDLLELAADEPGPDVEAYWGQLDDIETPRRLGIRGGGGDLFCDGSIGSHTAALGAPYSDDASTSGNLRYDADQVAGHVLACVEAGLQAGFHVIGDRAIAAVLDGFEATAVRVGLPRVVAGRHRLEHAEMLDDVSVARIARLGLVVSAQPAFDAAWGGPAAMYAERLGERRAATLNPFAALAAAGVPLAFGSDAPVTPLDPWGGVRAAVLHRTQSQRLSARAAFAAHTRGGWRAVGRDDAGLLVPGAPATLAVWDVDELTPAAPEVRVAAWSTDLRAGVAGLPSLERRTPVCLRTVVRGNTVFDRF